MKALLFSNTDEDDYTCQLPVILATGSEVGSQSIVEEFSDELAELMDRWDSCTFHLWGTDKESVPGREISFVEVVDAFFSGKTHELSIDIKANCYLGYYTLNFAIRDIPVSPSSRLRAAYAKAMNRVWNKERDLLYLEGKGESDEYDRACHLALHWRKVKNYWKEN